MEVNIFDEFNYTAQRFKMVLEELKNRSFLIDRRVVKNIEDSAE